MALLNTPSFSLGVKLLVLAPINSLHWCWCEICIRHRQPPGRLGEAVCGDTVHLSESLEKRLARLATAQSWTYVHVLRICTGRLRFVRSFYSNTAYLESYCLTLYLPIGLSAPCGGYAIARQQNLDEGRNQIGYSTTCYRQRLPWYYDF